MPVYSVVYRHQAFESEADAKKQANARSITELHCALTGAAPNVVKVFFYEYCSPDIWCAGETVDHYVRATGQVRVGRAREVNEGSLKGMYKVVKRLSTGAMARGLLRRL